MAGIAKCFGECGRPSAAFSRARRHQQLTRHHSSRVWGKWESGSMSSMSTALHRKALRVRGGCQTQLRLAVQSLDISLPSKSVVVFPDNSLPFSLPDIL
jgi:hypothetical protein